MSRPLRRWADLDTLGLRLFVLMWAALVASHMLSFAAVLGYLGGLSQDPQTLQAMQRERPPAGALPLPVFPSLPPQPGSLPRPADEGPGRQPGLAEASRAQGAPPHAEPGDAAHAARPLPAFGWSAWLLDYGVRLLAIGLAAWWGSRWLARPMRRLVQASSALAPALARGQSPADLDEHLGTREVRESTAVFNRMSRQIQQQFNERGLMIAAISHDLRTPLTRLRMRLENAGVEPALRERCVQDIREMGALIDTVMEVFRTPDEAGSAPQAQLDLAALLQAQVDDLVEQGAKITFEGQPVILRADPALLRRVVGNLLDNALRYAGQAHVRLLKQDAQVVLQVDDDGPGIPEAELERVLQPFSRLETSRNRHTGGTGLGLYIARELVLRSGGQLRLLNRDGGGLRAEVRLAA